jgi:hypothetical protein
MSGSTIRIERIFRGWAGGDGVGASGVGVWAGGGLRVGVGVLTDGVSVGRSSLVGVGLGIGVETGVWIGRQAVTASRIGIQATRRLADGPDGTSMLLGATTLRTLE